VINATYRIEWHDLRIAPYDLPDEEENVLVTVENLEDGRRVLADVYLKELNNGDYCWCTKDPETKEEIMVWYEVVAWTYYPKPYCKYWY
jgi:hypothetical protein